jgi:hypothetical protein
MNDTQTFNVRSAKAHLNLVLAECRDRLWDGDEFQLRAALKVLERLDA